MSRETDDRPAPRLQFRTCTSCGHEWIGPTTTCPICGAISKSDGSEMMKKIFEPPDLAK